MEVRSKADSIRSGEETSGKEAGCCQERDREEGTGQEESGRAEQSRALQNADSNFANPKFTNSVQKENAEIGVKLQIAWIGKTKEVAIRALTDEYLKRISRYVGAESHEMNSEPALLELAADTTGRTAPVLILLDARGRQFTSEEFANLLRDQQDRGTQNLFFAVGPADGFSDKARGAADLILSFGKMTLAHELARVVLLEQIYRAFTILKGHPYHTGH
ncbi:MAG: 23S rRNA (pseudouridine(1915)-N(3))-methyltransferase RlmH [Candidatus Angelobacter sp.]